MHLDRYLRAAVAQDARLQLICSGKVPGIPRRGKASTLPSRQNTYLNILTPLASCILPCFLAQSCPAHNPSRSPSR